MKGPNGINSTSSSVLFGKGAVGVVELNGVIMESKRIVKKLERFEEDKDIKAVVLRLNSPGGAVAPSQEIYEVVKNYKKPLVVSMSSVAASGAYYIASGSKKVFANPGTITGSIGVIMEFANLEKLYNWAKIQRYVIKTGKFKDSGAEYREMSPEERELLQGMVDDVLVQFKQAVAEGRKLTMEQVTALADGRIFSGSQAKKVHLVDELGSFQDAVKVAAEQGGIKGKPHLVYAEKQKIKLLDLILDDRNDDYSESSEDSSTSIQKPMSLLEGLIGILSGRSLSEVVRSENISNAVHSMGSSSQVAPGIYWLWTGYR